MNRSVPLLTRLAKQLGPHRCGVLAEKMALVSYLIRGYQPLVIPQRIAQTDLILRRGSLILLVEVKFRSQFHRTHTAVTPVQRKRLEHQMRALVGRFPQCAFRIELCFVTLKFPFIERIQTPYI